MSPQQRDPIPSLKCWQCEIGLFMFPQFVLRSVAGKLGFHIGSPPISSQLQTQ